MTTIHDTQKKDEDSTLSARIYNYLQKNRKGLFAGLIVIIMILVALAIGSTIMGKIKTNAFSKLEALNRRYEALKTNSADEDSGSIEKQAEIAVLLVELGEYQSKNSGFAAARAYCISAEIYAGQKNWAEAEEAWSKAAKAAAKTYLEPICIFNAGVAAEEQGNIEPAVDYYKRSLGFGKNFPSAAKAQFSVGRLEEERKNMEAALEAYRALLANWPNDPVWSNLAQNRILLLAD
jgi:tetratricopeptide (TPR) repeat protein